MVFRAINAIIKLRQVSVYSRTLYDATYVYLVAVNRTLSAGGGLADIRNGSAIVPKTHGLFTGDFTYPLNLCRHF